MSNPNAKRQIDERNKARIQQAHMSKRWEECARFCCPEKEVTARNLAQISNENYTPEPVRMDDTAVNGLRVLSGGIKAWVCPGPTTAWFSWEPHASLENDTQVKDWLADCTARADKIIDRAGFYTQSHLVFQDLGVFGTAGLFIDSTGDAPLTIKALSPTQFTFAVDFDGELSAVRVTYWLTAEAMLEKFGAENVPDTVRLDVESNKGETMHEMIHAVYRRPNAEILESEAYQGNPLRMPWASCWIHVQREVFMEEGGYEEMPFVVPRWRLVTGGNDLYGVAPALDALASERGVNLMDMVLAVNAEISINPRIKAPPGTGAVDLSPGGITQVDAGMDGPVEWLSDGPRGMLQSENFLKRKEKQVLRAFHADLFEQLAPIAQERQMTNGLVEALQRESVARISPAMGQLASGYIDPVMQRIFMVLRRRGQFAEPPDSAFYTDAAGQRYLVFPRVVQTSRMAAALNSRKVFAYRSAMERILPLVQIKPDLLDLYNWEVMHRDLDRGDGMPVGWHLSEEERFQLRAARAEAQQAQQEQAMAMELATKQPDIAMQAAQAAGQPA